MIKSNFLSLTKQLYFLKNKNLKVTVWLSNKLYWKEEEDKMHYFEIKNWMWIAFMSA